MDDCIFCNFCEDQSEGMRKQDILFETSNFGVKVGIGILSPGHVMIISKKHMSCFGALPNQLDKEFLNLKSKVFDMVKNLFSEPFIYEQGIWGQSVSHAHIHFVPLKSMLYSIKNLNSKIFTSFDYVEATNFDEVKNFFKRESLYFFLEENNNKYVYSVNNDSNGSQAQRGFRSEFKRITKIKGLENWKDLSDKNKSRDLEWREITKDCFRGIAL